VYEVASFYSMFETKPVGRTTLSVCTNISCMLRGSRKWWPREKKLGIKTGESTPDGRIYLKREEECLAACGYAPMMMVNHYHERLTTEKVDEILDGLNKPWQSDPHAQEHQVVFDHAAFRQAVDDGQLSSRSAATRAWREDPRREARSGALIEEIKKASGLRGRGGAGFPTGMKWSLHAEGRRCRSTWCATRTNPSRAPAKIATSCASTRIR
jgi:hypothetical protein